MTAECPFDVPAWLENKLLPLIPKDKRHGMASDIMGMAKEAIPMLSYGPQRKKDDSGIHFTFKSTRFAPMSLAALESLFETSEKPPLGNLLRWLRHREEAPLRGGTADEARLSAWKQKTQTFFLADGRCKVVTFAQKGARSAPDFMVTLEYVTEEIHGIIFRNLAVRPRWEAELMYKLLDDGSYGLSIVTLNDMYRVFWAMTFVLSRNTRPCMCDYAEKVEAPFDNRQYLGSLLRVYDAKIRSVPMCRTPKPRSLVEKLKRTIRGMRGWDIDFVLDPWLWRLSHNRLFDRSYFWACFFPTNERLVMGTCDAEGRFSNYHITKEDEVHY